MAARCWEQGRQRPPLESQVSFSMALVWLFFALCGCLATAAPVTQQANWQARRRSAGHRWGSAYQRYERMGKVALTDPVRSILQSAVSETLSAHRKANLRSESFSSLLIRIPANACLTRGSVP